MAKKKAHKKEEMHHGKEKAGHAHKHKMAKHKGK